MNQKFYDFYLRELFEQERKGCKIFLIIFGLGGFTPKCDPPIIRKRKKKLEKNKK